MSEWWRSVYWCPSVWVYQWVYLSVSARPAKKGERVNWDGGKRGVYEIPITLLTKLK